MRQLCPIWIIILFNAILLQGQTSNLDVSGRIEADSLLIRNIPAFRAELISDTIVSFRHDTILLGNVWRDTPSMDQNLPFDNNDDFDTSSGIFKVPRDGLYSFELNLVFRCCFFGDEVIHSFLSINNSLSSNCVKGYFILYNSGNIGSQRCNPRDPIPRKTRSLNGLVKLQKNDIVRVYFSYPYQQGFCTFNGLFLEKGSSFSGYLISDF